MVPYPQLAHPWYSGRGGGESCVRCRPVQLLRLGMDGDILSCWTGGVLTASGTSAFVSDDSTVEDEPCLEDESEPWGLGLAPWAPPGETSATDSQATATSSGGILDCSVVHSPSPLPECMGLGCPLLRDDRWLLRRRRPPTMATAGEKTEGGGGLPILENRDSISSRWRVCKAWISIMCLGKHR